jgi:hypothetical protein
VGIIVLQIARISAISHEFSSVRHYYPQTHTLILSLCSIFLGALSIFLEGVLLWALKKRKITGIQPWFLTTFVIFLFASLAFAITASLYVIRPFDHNIKVRRELHGNVTLDDFKDQNAKNRTPHIPDSKDELTRHIQKVLRPFVHPDEDQIFGANESVLLTAVLNDTEIFSETIPLLLNRTKCSKKELALEMKFYSVRPTLSLSFLFDVLRSFPQLFLVNRYVKSERLHHMHYHSHASLATLYVKQ